MATPLTDSINALTQYANETTGKSDITLSDAVGSLVEGYGGGSKVITGTYTPTEDVYVKDIQIPHNLEIVPDFIIAYADGITSDASYASTYIVVGACTKINATSPQTPANHQTLMLVTRQNFDQIWVQYTNENGTKFLNESWVKIPYYNNGNKLKAGVTYHYAFGTYT